MTGSMLVFVTKLIFLWESFDYPMGVIGALPCQFRFVNSIAGVEV